MSPTPPLRPPTAMLVALAAFAFGSGAMLWLVDGNPLVGPGIASLVFLLYMTAALLTGRLR